MDEADGTRLVLDGGTRPRQRRAASDSWTAAKEQAFLAALAGSCNVKLAAKAAGVSTSAIYVRRSKDATFRRGWDRALAAGYAALEMMMLERALHGVEKTVIRKNGESEVMRDYSDRTGLALLRLHRDTAYDADEEADPSAVGEAAARIMARLAKLQPGAGTGAVGETVETKARVDALDLIRWAFGARQR